MSALLGILAALPFIWTAIAVWRLMRRDKGLARQTVALESSFITRLDGLERILAAMDGHGPRIADLEAKIQAINFSRQPTMTRTLR